MKSGDRSKRCSSYVPLWEGPFHVRLLENKTDGEVQPRCARSAFAHCRPPKNAGVQLLLSARSKQDVLVLQGRSTARASYLFPGAGFIPD